MMMRRIPTEQHGYDGEDEHGHDGQDEPGHDGDEPVGTRRVTGLERAPGRRQLRRSSATARTARAGRRESSSAAVEGRRRSPRRTIGRILALIAIVLGAAVLWFLAELFQPFHGSPGARVRVTIPAHLSSSQVGNLLARDGVVSSGFFFELRATLAGERGSLRSGTYELRKDMTYGAVLKVLTTPPPVAKVTELTVIEGETRRQLATLLRHQGIGGDYLAQTRRSPELDPARYGAPRGIPSLEGFLFPSTYQLREPVTVAALVSDQLRTFRRRFDQVTLGYARRKHLSPYDVLIIASIIQGEARTARDRALISSVIYNRLRYHMPLQMDDTVRYATGNYTSPITVSELHARSPWNTYLSPGLPLTPIDNPGLAAMQAAAHPAQTSYLYFVVKPCGNGSHAFASSYAQFQALETQYNSARYQRGGRSPEFCH